MLFRLSIIVVGTVAFLSGQDAATIMCSKQIDCPFTQTCQMPDFTNYPSIWPPCPHVGTCVCPPGTVQLSNQTCVNFASLSLGQQCCNYPFEMYPTMAYCSNSVVACRSPFTNQNGYCAPPTTPAPPPYVATPFITSPPFMPPTSTIVSFQQYCDQTHVCATTAGLSCQSRGPNSTYAECLCTNSQWVFDTTLALCRQRLYADLCIADADCQGGLIGSAGVVCRIGRCRCAVGYDPQDNLYWNETTKTTYKRRICITNTAISWVPTGQACTINPHLYSQYSTTRVCQERAFCHLCFAQRGNVNWNVTDYEKQYTSSVPTIGTCRELTCGGTGGCAGVQTSCNFWNNFINPPCSSGMCDCNTAAGFYKNKFSRCDQSSVVELGERCIPAGQLNNWYVDNEIWNPISQICLALNSTSASMPAVVNGYAGYAFGIIKCNLPYVEDADGTCVRNDDPTGIYIQQTLNYNDACDPQDNRIPRQVCNSAKGLTCQKVSDGSNHCMCGTMGVGGTANPTCSGTGSTSILWDGNVCRQRTYGDPCTTTNDCAAGGYFPGWAPGQCLNGFCSCYWGYTAVTITTNSFDNTVGMMSTTSKLYCMNNYTTVSAGQNCHIDALSWYCKVGQFAHIPYVPTTPTPFSVSWTAPIAPMVTPSWTTTRPPPPPPTCSPISSSGMACAPGSVSVGAQYGYGYCNIYLPPQICSSGTFCMRCPADYGPDDQLMGICRTVGPQPTAISTPCSPGHQPPSPPSPSWSAGWNAPPTWTVISWTATPTAPSWSWNGWIAPHPSWNAAPSWTIAWGPLTAPTWVGWNNWFGGYAPNVAVPASSLNFAVIALAIGLVIAA